MAKKWRQRSNSSGSSGKRLDVASGSGSTSRSKSAPVKRKALNGKGSSNSTRLGGASGRSGSLSGSVGSRSGSLGSRSGSVGGRASSNASGRVGGSIDLTGSMAESRTIGGLRKERELAVRRLEREERRVEKKRKNRLPFIILGVVGGVVIAALIAFLIVSNTNAFKIEQIEFTGNDHLTSEEVNALVSIPEGTTLLNVDTSSIEKSLERDAWVEKVKVKKVFPNKLQIDIKERKIGAVVEITVGKNQTTQNWAIANDGMWLMAIPSRNSEIGSKLSEKIYEDADAALHISGVPYGIQPQIGTYNTDANVENAIKIVDGMTTELAGRVKAIKATDAESTQLTLDNNIEIAFGTPDNIRDKERICLQIMKDNPTVVYINVRVPDRPTWRAV